MRHHSKSPFDQPTPSDLAENMPFDAATVPNETAPSAPPEPRSSGHEDYRPGPYDHERLEAYRVAREALVSGEPVARALPPEQAGLASELRRALVAAQLGVAQAAARGCSDRGERFGAARGDVARAAAALDGALALGLVERSAIEPTLTLLGRLSAMLVRLSARS